MRTVVAIPDVRVRDRLIGLLQARGAEAVAIKDFPISAADIDQHRPDLVICQPRELKLARAGKGGLQRLVLVVIPHITDASVNEAMDGKADDFLAATACSAEMTARIEMAARHTERLKARAGDQVQALQVWQDAPTMLSQEIGGLFGVFMYPAIFDAEREAHRPDFTATIGVTASTEDMIIRLVVGISQTEAERLGHYAFGGEVDEAVTRDALREISNCVAGAFKRTALTEGLTVTIGLPSDCRTEDLQASDRVWVAESENFALSIGISKAAQGSVRLRACDLEPGMVIKHDVCMAGGAALIRAGTALTERTASRLLELVDPSAMIDVTKPA